jgi:hypothetical protein
VALGSLALVAAAAIIYVALGPQRGIAPIALPLLWLAVVGPGVDAPLTVAGATVPVSYLVLLTVLSAQFLSVARVRGAASVTAPWRLYLALLVTPLVLAVLGTLGGNSISVVRTEALLLLVAPSMALITARSETQTRFESLAALLIICGALAASKSIFVATTGLVSQGGAARVLDVYSSVNPQFGVQRVIPNGGDTVMALTLPIMVALIRSSSQRLARVAILCLPITIIGLVLTYTRTLIAGAAVGCLVSWIFARKRTGGGRRGGILRLALVGVIATFLLGLSYGQSNLTASEALTTRFTGDASQGVSSSSERTDEALAAIHAVRNPVLGEGLGSQFTSTLANVGTTDYAHIGYVWLFLKGGLLLVGASVGACVWATLRFWKASRRAVGAARGVSAGLAGATVTFAVINLVVNRFASVDGMIFFGLLLACANLVSSPERVRRLPDQAVPGTDMARAN